MWPAAVESEELGAAIAGRTEIREAMLRLFGIPESEIAETLRVARGEGVDLDRLEVTTCLRRGEVEVVTRFGPGDQAVYDAFAAVVALATPTRSSRATGRRWTSRSPRSSWETDPARP
jgi:nicotinamide-nucleotide amidase